MFSCIFVQPFELMFGLTRLQSIWTVGVQRQTTEEKNNEL